MKTAKCKLKSVSPYSQSRYIQVEKKPKELHDAFEKRTWRERCHVDEYGFMFIPPMQFCNSAKEAAKMLAIPIPGQGKALFTKNFEGGVLVFEGIKLPIKAEDVPCEAVFVPSDGKRGGGHRVMKYFPLIKSWEGTVTYTIFDDIITKDVFEQVVKASGQLIGIGRFRPRNWGYYGRFIVEKIEWSEQ
jgi:hypothetical protein